MKKKSFLSSNFFYLVMLSFVFVATSALSMASQVDISSIIPKTKKVSASYAPLPVLAASATFPVLSAQGAMAIDLTSYVTLYEKNVDYQLLPASTTKIVTAMVSLDSYQLSEVIKVGSIKVEGQKMGLSAGEEITVENLLYGLLVYSANDAAEALAEAHSGGRSGFIASMNAKASELHLTNTVFANPTGLDGVGHLSTAKDLIRVSEIAMQNETFARIVSTKEKLVSSVDGRIKHKLTNINQLLGKVDGVQGVKTGWTEGARENLVTYIERDGRKIMIAILGSQDRFGETEEMITWIFSNYTWEEVGDFESKIISTLRNTHR